MLWDELNERLLRGEDSLQQFKVDISSPDALAAELIAFSNTAGGTIFLGVSDDGRIVGVDSKNLARLNQLLSNVATHNVRPPINPFTRNIVTEQGVVMVVDVPAGLNKPYMDAQGRIWVKNGADKRHVTAREEMQLLFQQSGLIHADEVPVSGANIGDLNVPAFEAYFARRYEKSVSATGLSVDRLLENLNLARNGVPNLAGWLLFGHDPQRFTPAFLVKAVAFPGTALHESRYLDSEDFSGSLPDLYQGVMAFIRRNLHHVQGDQGFNSPGLLEIPLAVFEELVVNALVHRDYFISAPIRVLIFSNRVEIVSPGHLPNHLDVEKIRFGLSNLRNPVLASHAFRMLPYRGLGSGIPRATELWPNIEFVDDRWGAQFTACVIRSGSGVLTGEVTGEAAGEVAGEVHQLLVVMDGDMKRGDLMRLLGLKHEDHFRKAYLRPALDAGFVVMTKPDKPRSSAQRYRLTAKGRAVRSAHAH